MGNVGRKGEKMTLCLSDRLFGANFTRTDFAGRRGKENFIKRLLIVNQSKRIYEKSQFQ